MAQSTPFSAPADLKALSSSPRPILIAALTVAAAPLVFTLPLWALAWLIVCWGYCLGADRLGWPNANRKACLSIFIVGLLLVMATAGRRFDGADFITMLAVMAGLKPLENRNYRDSMVTSFLGYFLVITSLFVFENLSMTVYLFISVWITTGALIRVNHPLGPFGPQLRLAGRFVLLAIPLTALFFLLFPRVSGGFWGSPWNRQGIAGFAENIRLGDVAQLALNDAPAFSVSFEGPVPGPEQRYWRGVVFDSFDGQTWRPERSPLVRQDIPTGGQSTTYTVILEPSGSHYLFALDLPLSADPLATITRDNNLVVRQAVRQRLRYRATSLMDARQMDARHPGERLLQLPKDRNLRAIAQGRLWRQELKEPEAVMAAGLQFFKDKGFSYTLQPGRLGADAVDNFLFNSRRGFCEHFAVSFTVLMRAAGLPTRMVGGYQGGSWNELGGFISVRQADAHVWCEVWLDGKGWIRVDPTAMVSPERISGGSDDQNWSEGGQTLLLRWYETLDQTWEAINMQWNMWFMGFSAEDQLALWQRLVQWFARYALWFILPLVIGLMLGIFTLRRSPRRRAHTANDAALLVYRRFLSKMQEIGMPVSLSQGPEDYARAVAERFSVTAAATATRANKHVDPVADDADRQAADQVAAHAALNATVTQITACYIALRYSKNTDSATAAAVTLQDLQTLVRRFQPRKIMAMVKKLPAKQATAK